MLNSTSTISNLTTSKSFNFRVCQILTGLAVASVFLLIPSVAFAVGDSDVGDEIDELVTEANKIDSAYDAGAPSAIAATVFGAGSKILKRIIYA